MEQTSSPVALAACVLGGKITTIQPVSLSLSFFFVCLSLPFSLCGLTERSSLFFFFIKSINNYKMSKVPATFITFLFSSILHEYFMAVLSRVFRPYLFFLQMLQLPLIYGGRYVKGTRLGNLFFWYSIVVRRKVFRLCSLFSQSNWIQLGPPLLGVLYTREYYLLHAHSN
jgi:hypothetical protein